MSLRILDTDVLTLYQRGDPAVARRVQSVPLTQLAVTIISVEEELTGWYTRLRRARKREQLAHVYQRLTDAVRFLTRFHILSFTESAIVRYEQLRTTYRRSVRMTCASPPSFWSKARYWRPGTCGISNRSRGCNSKTGADEV